MELKVRRFAGIGRCVSRPLFALLIAFAMLFAPLAMPSGAAVAMAPADHHSQTMKSGHCDEQPAKSHDGKAMDKGCCAAMCTGVAIAPALPAEPHALTAKAERPGIDRFHHSFLAELPTPPPKLA